MLAAVLFLGALPGVAAGQEPLVVRELSFRGNRSIDDLTLANAIETTTSSAFATLPLVRSLGLGSKRYLVDRTLERDVERIRLFYRISGFLEVAVDTTVRRTDTDAWVTFHITEGRPVLVRRLEIGGLDSLPDPEALRRDLPLEVGDPFNRHRLRETADTLADRLRDQGYPLAAVFLAGRQVDSARYAADVSLEVAPGRRMTVGAIRVEGARDEGDSVFVRNFLATRSGRLYRQTDLFRSQRNLALSDLYRFASVDIDSASFTPEDERVPLVVRVVPGPQQRITSSVGYGTDDCFRGSLGWTGRNALGQGRILELSARASKIGAGDPAALGFERSVCPRLEADSVGSRELNYSVSAAVRRPGFLGPANNLAVTLFAELGSQFGVFARQEFGGSVTLTRETASRIPVTVGYRLGFGETRANDVNFCAYFNACNPDDIVVLRERQRQGMLSVTLSSLRVNNLLDPTRGSSVGLQVAYSGAVTGSEELQRFLRVSGDAAVYQSVSRNTVLAGRVRAGLLIAPLFEPTGGRAAFRYVPPDQRFYAGGPNDVRGFDGNQLGPVVYVIFDTAAVTDPAQVDPDRVSVSPIGGNRVLVGNLELRFPSPVFRSRMRLVTFLDAGAVWEDDSQQGSPIRARLTPGAGLRFSTPLGPARLDLAYNPYGLPAGDLFASRADGTLTLVQRGYVKQRSAGFTFHFAVGQAF